MARGDKRGNREAKKPKQEKAKNPIPASPLARQVKSSVPPKPPGRKRIS